MQQQTSYEPAGENVQPRQKAQAPITERLWRNQLGIILAVALTLAAVAILLLSRSV